LARKRFKAVEEWLAWGDSPEVEAAVEHYAGILLSDAATLEQKKKAEAALRKLDTIIEPVSVRHRCPSCGAVARRDSTEPGGWYVPHDTYICRREYWTPDYKPPPPKAKGKRYTDAQKVASVRKVVKATGNRSSSHYRRNHKRIDPDSPTLRSILVTASFVRGAKAAGLTSVWKYVLRRAKV
jgi:hypothetical protein